MNRRYFFYGLPEAAALSAASSVHIRNRLTRSGVCVLHNSAIRLDVRRLDVRGLPLWLAFAKVSCADAPILVMNHNPDRNQDCAPSPWDLMLCGHALGSQVALRYVACLHALETRGIPTPRGVRCNAGLHMNRRPENTALLVS